MSDINWCQLASSHEILKKSTQCKHVKHGTWFRGPYFEEARHMFLRFEPKLQFSQATLCDVPLHRNAWSQVSGGLWDKDG